MSADDTINHLLEELSAAKDWPKRFQKKSGDGFDVSHEVREADKKIQALEKLAQEAMKRLGCNRPETRSIYQGMADMLISWHTFKDRIQ